MATGDVCGAPECYDRWWPAPGPGLSLAKQLQEAVISFIKTEAAPHQPSGPCPASSCSALLQSQVISTPSPSPVWALAAAV